MNIRSLLGALALSAAALALAPLAGTAHAAPLSGTTAATAAQAGDGPVLESVQYRGGYGGRGYGPGPRAYGPGPRPYYAPHAYGPPRAYGPGPAWGYRPWYRRPYYGTIIGGIALGSILAVTAYGLAPRPPRPDLCWYWSDEIQSQGYWDYC